MKIQTSTLLNERTPKKEDAIYWDDRRQLITYAATVNAMRDSIIPIKDIAEQNLKRRFDWLLPRLGWQAWHIEKEEHADSYETKFQWTCFEGIVFASIKHIDESTAFLYLLDNEGNEKKHALRRAMYYGQRVYGIVVDGVLYIAINQKWGGDEV